MQYFDAVVVGSGAAGYSAAEWLFSLGVKNIAVVTENRLSGTSRNTGSDKQTYYKLGLDGNRPDSARKMAEAYISGGACDGVKAYIECVNSARCFYRLVDCGVKFPRDCYGGYVSYLTDHDDVGRATSVGPYTSKIMTEALEKRVTEHKIPIISPVTVQKIVTCDGKACGIIGYNNQTDEITAIRCRYVIACTGAPASVYKNSVFPVSQKGMTGVLIDAGCSLANFQEWQYGMASVDFRWNVSGSYMQVLPRFVSVDPSGNEKEFLNEYFTDFAALSENVFLKGYQWPYHVEKASSVIDELVNAETEKGNSVYLDFTKNSVGFSFEKMNETAREYLEKSDALCETPVERLLKMNPKAYLLYKENGIDLKKDYLKIAVCAQHNNGGVWVDDDYQTDVKNLFAAGEVAGVFGVTRPGGSALNCTQVSSLRAAEYISKNTDADYTEKEKFALASAFAAAQSEKEAFSGGDENYSHIPAMMSTFAAFNREEEGLCRICEEIEKIFLHGVSAESYGDFLAAKDMLLSAFALAKSIMLTMPETGSRGSARYVKDGKVLPENKEMRRKIAVYKDGRVNFENCRPIPVADFWFEQIYNAEE